MDGEIAPTPVATIAQQPAVLDVAPVAPAAPISAVPEVAPVAPVDAPTVVESAASPAVETLIEAASEPAGEPVAEPAPPVEGEPAAEVPPAEVAPIAYEAFRLPEGFSPADEQIKSFTDLIGTHQVPQETAQKLIDLHTSELKKFADTQAQSQQDVWAQTNKQWQADAQKEFGNRYDTTLNDAKAAIAKLVPNAAKRTALFQALSLTGAGNHPAVIAAFAAVGKLTSEPRSPLPSAPRKASGQPWDHRYSGQGK